MLTLHFKRIRCKSCKLFLFIYSELLMKRAPQFTPRVRLSGAARTSRWAAWPAPPPRPPVPRWVESAARPLLPSAEPGGDSGLHPPPHQSEMQPSSARQTRPVPPQRLQVALRQLSAPPRSGKLRCFFFFFFCAQHDRKISFAVLQ